MEQRKRVAPEDQSEENEEGSVENEFDSFDAKRSRKNPENDWENQEEEENDWEKVNEAVGEEEDYYSSDEEEEPEEDDDEVAREREVRRKKKERSSRFIELEAEVDEEDEEEEPEEIEEVERELIDDEETEGPDEASSSIQRRRALLDSMRSENPEELRRFVRERYGELDEEEDEQNKSGSEEEVEERDFVRDKGIEQQGLLPTVQDPKLFLVKCRIGREKEAVICLLQKYLEYNKNDSPLEFFSAVAPEHLRGYVYIEAYTADAAKKAVDGLRVLFPTTLKLIPIQEMVDVLTIIPETNHLERGDWVRISRGTHAGDLAQVYDFREGESVATVRLIPRLNLQDIRDESNDVDDATRKRLSSARPPQRLFKREEIERTLGAQIFPRRDRFTGEVFDTFRNENYRDGLLYKRVAIRNLIIGDQVAPTFEELEMFHKAHQQTSNSKHDNTGNDENELDDTMQKTLELSLDSLSTDVQKNMNFCVGDGIRVISGDLKNLTGRIESIEADNMIAVRPDDPDLKKELIQFSRDELRKYFSEGSHVKAISGRHAGETGMVVGISGDLITVFSDITNEEIRLHVSQLTETTEEGTSQDNIGGFQLLDLVTLHSDVRTRGVIVGIHQDHATLLDTNGTTRNVSVKNIRNKLDGKKVQALDVNHKPVQVGDSVKIVQGVHKNREGIVRQVASPFIFVHVKDEPQNCGLIVVRSQNCKGPHSVHENYRSQLPAAPSMKSGSLTSAFSLSGNDLKARTLMNKPIAGGNIGKGRKDDDKLVRQDVLIKSGPWKGYVGKVVSATTASVRVELDSVCKTVTVDRSRLIPKDTENLMPRAESGRPLDGAYTPSYEVGSRTPAYLGAGTATPLHHIGYTPIHAPFTPTRDSIRRDTPRTPIHNAWRPTTPGNDYTGGKQWSELGLSMYSPFASQGTPSRNSVSKPVIESVTTTNEEEVAGQDNAVAIAKARLDVLMQHKNMSNIRGFVVGHSPDGMYVNIEVESSIAPQLLQDMLLVSPEKNDHIKVVEGEYSGMRGQLLNAEGDEGIVQFDDGEIKILSVSSLGKVRQ